MKKKLVLLLFLTTSLLYPQHSFSDLKKENLKGTIKTLFESYFEVEPIYKEIQDEEGYPDLKIIGYKKGKPKGTDAYLGYKDFYNKKGFITEHYQYSYGELSQKTSYIRNENNQKTDLTTYNYVDGMFIAREKHYAYSYIYSTGQLIEKITHIATEKLYATTIYTYNEGGKLLQFLSEYVNSGQKTKQEYRYDSKNYLTKIITYSKGKQGNGPTFINDAQGNSIETKRYKKSSNSIKEYTVENKYTYDHTNNWIKKISYTDRIQETITLREIEYY